MVLLQSRDHRTHTYDQTAQKNTKQNTPAGTDKETRASACGFPNPNSVVELKGGSRASIFSIFYFLFFFGETSPNFDLKNLISTYLLYTKDFFHRKKWAQIHQVPKKNKIQVAIFL
jgi:hypothetical protein